ncbi:hypothetical protein GCM10014715_66130 [Streptomyces spiralis]|uniref:Uncharacterized protein n=1 Tax=Streptomyces spiralis TaxID=66376 RepID=A0A919AEG0_9ACTN|nr:hypothetical protein GCM10014715_66130 [Streptomyces spiralis]
MPGDRDTARMARHEEALGSAPCPTFTDALKVCSRSTGAHRETAIQRLGCDGLPPADGGFPVLVWRHESYIRGGRREPIPKPSHGIAGRAPSHRPSRNCATARLGLATFHYQEDAVDLARRLSWGVSTQATALGTAAARATVMSA